MNKEHVSIRFSKGKEATGDRFCVLAAATWPLLARAALFQLKTWPQRSLPTDQNDGRQYLQKEVRNRKLSIFHLRKPKNKRSAWEEQCSSPTWSYRSPHKTQHWPMQGQSHPLIPMKYYNLFTCDVWHQRWELTNCPNPEWGQAQKEKEANRFHDYGLLVQPTI